MKITRNTFNGKFIGCFYDLDDGQKLYLGHRTYRERWDDAWWFDQFTLRKCQEGGYALGVIVKSRGIWIISYPEFENSEFRVKRIRDGLQLQGLPMTKFPVNPEKCKKRIAKRMTIRR